MTEETFKRAHALRHILKELDMILATKESNDVSIYKVLDHIMSIQPFYLANEIRSFIETIRKKCEAEKEKLTKELSDL